MTITQKLYNEINNKLIAVLEEYRDQMSQYDLLTVATNFLVGTMATIMHFDHMKKEDLIKEIIELLNTVQIDDFVSRN